MKTVAEGVEDRVQLGILQEMGCDLVQGWLFSKAMPAQETGHYLAQMQDPVELSVNASPSVGAA
jgi:EAL domain-containing protein (putative c-di-GMP-specific phosphodiesterase class I)